MHRNRRSIFATPLAVPSRTRGGRAVRARPLYRGDSGGAAAEPFVGTEWPHHHRGRLCTHLTGQNWVTWLPWLQGSPETGCKGHHPSSNPLPISVPLFFSLMCFSLPMAWPSNPLGLQRTVHGLLEPLWPAALRWVKARLPCLPPGLAGCAFPIQALQEPSGAGTTVPSVASPAPHSYRSSPSPLLIHECSPQGCSQRPQRRAGGEGLA